MNDRGNKGGTRITSKLTPLYKFYIPMLVIELFLFNTILLIFNFYPGDDISVFLAVEVLLMLWALLLFPCFKLSQMDLKDGRIIAHNYFNSNEYSEKEVKKVHRFFLFFFKVKLNKISFVILPKLSESINLFLTPKSIQMLKNLI